MTQQPQQDGTEEPQAGSLEFRFAELMRRFWQPRSRSIDELGPEETRGLEGPPPSPSE